MWFPELKSLSEQIRPPSRFFAVSRFVLVTFSDIFTRMRRAEIWVRWTDSPSAFRDFNENPLKHAILEMCVHAQVGDIDCRNAMPRCLYFNTRASTPPRSTSYVSSDSSGRHEDPFGPAVQQALLEWRFDN